MDAQHAEVKDRVQRITLSVYRSRQIDAHQLFNDAFAGAVLTGPDGQPLCSANHPLSPSNPAVQSNLGNSPLSIDAIEETRIAMMEFTDDRGKRMLLQPDTIVVPPHLEMMAEEFLKSSGRADTANRTDNVRRGAYKILTLPLATDSNNWWMLDSAQAKLLAKWFERRKPVPQRDEDFDTETLKWKYVCRYSFGFHGWWWVFGHNVV